jgi:hypothetical protein
VTKDTDKGLPRPIIYLWLALSVLLNVSGIASIVDGIVHWANFFKDFLDIYRHFIREPISWAVHLVWPSWWPKIPPLVFDIFVIWSACFFAYNMSFIRLNGISLLAGIIQDQHLGIVGIIVVSFACFAVAPLAILVSIPALFFLSNEKDRRWTLDVLLYFFILVGAVVVLAFLNWQFQHIGR